MSSFWFTQPTAWQPDLVCHRTGHLTDAPVLSHLHSIRVNPRGTVGAQMILFCLITTAWTWLRIFPPPRVLAAARRHLRRCRLVANRLFERRLKMTQIYFYCSNAKEVLIDRCGAMVDDLAEARDRAASVVRSLTTARSLEDWRGWILHVNDDLGEELFVVPFAFVLGKPN